MHPLTPLLANDYIISSLDPLFAGGRRSQFAYALPSARAGFSRVNSKGPDPADDLATSQAELALDTPAGLSNAMAHAKRAVHQAIDGLFLLHGLQRSFGKLDFPQRLALMEDLGAFPTGLLAWLNRRRNLLEHEYSQPSAEEARQAVEVAELFLFIAYRFLGGSVVGVFAGLRSDDRCFEYVVDPFQGLLREYVLDVTTTFVVEGVTLHVNIPESPERRLLRTIALDKGSKPLWLPILEVLVYCTRREALRSGLVGPPGSIAISRVRHTYPPETGLPQPPNPAKA